MLNSRALPYIVCGIGTLYYAYIAFVLPSLTSDNNYGRFVYNYYYMALSQGHFDVPAQIIGLEGHYDSEGRAYVYHGIAPVITRVFAAPFVDLTTVSLTPFTLWLFASGGTIAYTVAFFRVVNASITNVSRTTLGMVFIFSVMLWTVSPGIIIVANDSLFHEPVSVAYFTVAVAISSIIVTAYENGNWNKTLIVVALMAGLTVFARPHIAIGMYAAVLALGAYLMLSKKRNSIRYVFVAMSILGACGVAVLALNAIRFGNPLSMHAELKGGELQYGFIFFGSENEASKTLIAISEHGRFNMGRILPNLMLYLGDLAPATSPSLQTAYAEKLTDIYDGLTQNLGYIRNEGPDIGILILWMPWIFFILIGLSSKMKIPKGVFFAFLMSIICVVFIASYATVTFRYRVELWPLIAALIFIATPGFLKYCTKRSVITYAILGMFGINAVTSSQFNMRIAVYYKDQFKNLELAGDWTYDFCAELVENQSPLGAESIPNICTITAK